jgi:hypothetical protein
MNIIEILQKLRDDIKEWVTNNLNAINDKIESQNKFITMLSPSGVSYEVLITDDGELFTRKKAIESLEVQDKNTIEITSASGKIYTVSITDDGELVTEIKDE